MSRGGFVMDSSHGGGMRCDFLQCSPLCGPCGLGLVCGCPDGSNPVCGPRLVDELMTEDSEGTI